MLFCMPKKLQTLVMMLPFLKAKHQEAQLQEIVKELPTECYLLSSSKPLGFIIEDFFFS